MCRSNPGEKGKYIKIILALLQSTSTAVVYECAVTLVSLSQAPTAVRAAANCFCQMLVSQSDNNVKLIVLDRLQVGLVFLAKMLHINACTWYLASFKCILVALSSGIGSGSETITGWDYHLMFALGKAYKSG